MSRLNECLIIWETVLGKGDWNALAFDGVRMESHTGENIVTSYPVSTGFNVSDHTIRQNSKIQLDAIISSVSMPSATLRQGYDAAFTTLCNAAAAVTGGTPTDLSGANLFGRLKYDNDNIKLLENSPIDDFLNATINNLTAQVSLEKVQRAFSEVVDLTRSGTIVHLLTMRGMYVNCVIRNYGVSNDVSNSYSLPISLSIEQLVVVSNLQRGNVLSATSDSNGAGVLDDLVKVWGI